MTLPSLLAIIHALAGAAWLGAMVYSLFVLHPRAHAYFARDAEFEAFIAAMSHGARWKVLLAMGVIALTGIGLMLLRWPSAPSPRWLTLVAAKAVLFSAALGLFVYTSWRLWPARVLAVPAEIPRYQRIFQRVGQAMITLAVLSTALGVLLHT